MRVIAVGQNSIAADLGIKPGDEVIRIEGQAVADIIDYKYLISEQELRLELRRAGRRMELTLRKPEDEGLGLEFEAMAIRRCGNRCVFCFVDQLPPGMRPSLYIKDEDYRLSFLHGAYVTLTNISDEEMNRIVGQRLSPLYVSVHASEPELRGRMLGNPLGGDILEKIAFLAEGGIEMHCQIVLCPGINDGERLRRTLADLSRFSSQVGSVSIVPVGLTRWREGLRDLRPVDEEMAKGLIAESSRWQKDFRKRLGTRLVYLSDEFYLSAGLPLPSADCYEDFAQVENGVGLARMFLDDFSEAIRGLSGRIKGKHKFVLVTGMLAGRLMEGVIRRLNRVRNLSVELAVAENKFFGESVTVSGLLTGGDILACLRKRELAKATVFLPPNCVNTDGVLLDDMSPAQMEEELGVPVKVGGYNLARSILAECQT